MPDMPNIMPSTLYTPRNADSTRPSPQQINIVIESLISRVLKGVLGLTVTVDKDPAGMTLRIDY